jgi:uncharacterized protein (TIGR03067 family)
MAPSCLIVSAIAWLAAMANNPAPMDDPRQSLLGVWVGQSMEADGKPVPEATAKRMRFTFKDDRLLIRGNFEDDREVACTYKLDAAKSPKHLEFTPENEDKAVLGVYDVNGDELKICMRHASSPGGRPNQLATQPNSRLILVIFKKQKP